MIGGSLPGRRVRHFYDGIPGIAVMGLQDFNVNRFLRNY